MIRVINASKDSDERLFFTEDMDASVEEFIPEGFQVTSDTKWDVNPPQGFPLETEFKIAG